VIINVADASNLERNLYLTTQIIDMDVKVVMALNMYDDLLRKGARLDYENLGKLLGIPFVPTVSSKGRGIKELFDKVIEVYEDKSEITRHIHINYGLSTEKAIKTIQQTIKVPENYKITDKFSSRFLAIKLLENDVEVMKLIETAPNVDKIKEIAKHAAKALQNELSDDTESIITDAKYGFISGALKETFKEGVLDRRKETDRIDSVATHKFLGFPIFLAFMFLMFQATFTLGEFPMNWIDGGVAWLSNFLTENMPNGMFKDLLIDGIIGGVGGVIVFLPNILI
ncbi:MAG TPA: ferrous iron transport protein B, partial [Bacteroidales bacterium]|nr:ferrous iron transport protein B [Bacteroidales bacterium]